MRYSLLTMLLAAALLHGCVVPPANTEEKRATALYDRRSHEAFAGDTEIERNYRKEMLRRVELSGPTHVNIHAYNGLALLTGEAPSTQLRDWAVNLARIIPGVKQVHDYIRLSRVSSETSRQNDARLKQTLENTLLQMQPIPNFHPSQIHISVEQGVVYLMGLVRRNEADAAINKIRTIDGVKEIITVFTYMG